MLVKLVSRRREEQEKKDAEKETEGKAAERRDAPRSRSFVRPSRVILRGAHCLDLARDECGATSRGAFASGPVAAVDVCRWSAVESAAGVPAAVVEEEEKEEKEEEEKEEEE